MGKSGVEDRDLGYKDILKELAKFKKMGVKVGITETISAKVVPISPNTPHTTKKERRIFLQGLLSVHG